VRLGVLLATGALVTGCEKISAYVQPAPDPPPPLLADPAPPPLPPPTPAEAFLDAEAPVSLLEQAKKYEAGGQLILARFALESKALSSEATPEETEFLAHICNLQGDTECVMQCATKLGKKLKFDGGTPRSAKSAVPPAPTASAREGELGLARSLFQKKKYDAARKLIEPSVLDNTASAEQIGLLRSVCAAQRDRMCVALCDAKLK
jgi:hypothetical protein